MELYDRLAELRKKSGFSQEQLAEKLSVTRQAISKWESGHGSPDIANIIKLSEIFGVSTDYLLKGTQPTQIPAPDNSLKPKKYVFLKKTLYILVFILGLSLIAVLFLFTLAFLGKTFLRRP